MRRISGIGAAAGGAWVGLQGLSAVREVGDVLPSATVGVASAVTAGLAIAAAVRTATSAWRGPRVEPLPEDDLAVCSPDEAESVRGAAQLRGTLGGAGHVHRRRLALPALGWTFAAGAALAGPDAYDLVPWVTALGVCVAASLALPAKAFLYREATGGRVVVSPAAAREELLTARRHAVEMAGEDGAR